MKKINQLYVCRLTVTASIIGIWQSIKCRPLNSGVMKRLLGGVSNGKLIVFGEGSIPKIRENDESIK